MTFGLLGFMQEGEPVEFIQAKNCGPARPNQKIDLCVIHTMEAAERPGTARNVAMWFGGLTKAAAPQASAHYCLDAADTIQCVKEDVVAWAAPGANKNGIHIEHAGYAAQTPIQWGDAYSQAVLERSAQLAADICKRHAIPIVRLSVADLQAGKRGLCGHIDITNAFNHGKGHTDPGPNFPWDAYIAMVLVASSPPTLPPPAGMTPPEDRDTNPEPTT
jgi:N-acetyl-anhydromuramyl-L-alanine amidase AmpD